MRLTLMAGCGLLILAVVLPSFGPEPRAQAASAEPDTTKMTPLELMAWRASQKAGGKKAEGSPELAPLPDGITALSGPEGSCREPTWAPDGKSLYFSSGRGRLSVIVRQDLADGSVTTVTDSLWVAESCDISPDGAHLVFSRKTHELGPKLWVLRLEDGENAKLSSRIDSGRELFPRWSTNGMRIYFEHAPSASMDTRAMMISREGENEEVLSAGTGMHTRPAVSPSGKKIAWVNRSGKWTQILVMDAKVSALVQGFEIPDRYVASIDWLPGDSRLVVSSLNVNDPRKGYDLGLFDLETGEYSDLLDLGKSELDPRVSPDGKRLAFAADREGKYSIYIYELP